MLELQLFLQLPNISDTESLDGNLTGLRIILDVPDLPAFRSIEQLIVVQLEPLVGALQVRQYVLDVAVVRAATVSERGVVQQVLVLVVPQVTVRLKRR